MKQVTIFLGNQCNAGCYYCHAAKEKDQFTEISPRLLDWLKQQTGLTVKFLGGEPTLYLEHIATVIKHCGDMSSYILMTNGLLLNNDQVVDFLNQHDILTIVSFDGLPGARGYDDIFLKDAYRDNLKRINKLGAAATISNVNCDLKAIRQCYAAIENKLQRYLPLFVHATHTTNSDLTGYELSDSQYDAFLAYKKNTIIKLIDEFDRGVINLKLKQIVHAYLDDVRYSLDETRCYNRHHIITDIAGNNYVCGYGKGLQVGQFGSEESFALQKQILDEKLPQCQQCELRSQCGVACIASINMKKECDHTKQFLSWLNREDIHTRLSLIKTVIQQVPLLNQTGNFFYGGF
ncbi:MAG: 4Fe-4S cluster-binding domain-containing protein [Sporomusaceae bacterium]|nr:4Fe-4S cluster-binding domain-containing protein [Sporomusaceae bacterium]